MKKNKLLHSCTFWCFNLGILLAAGCSPETGKSSGASRTGIPGGSSGDFSPQDPVSGAGGSFPWETESDKAGYEFWHTPQNDAGFPDSGDSGACQAVTALGENIEVEVPYEVIEPSPIALYIMLDASFSMTYDPPRWQPAVDAITAFINDPDSIGIDVAFETFPIPATDPQSATASSDCSGIGYNEPAVPMGPLPDNAAVITNYLATSGVGPVGIGTPMEAALNGATQYCAAYKQDKKLNPKGEDCVVILVTDGTPEILCNLDPVLVSDIAGQARTDSAVKTFSIGMAGADFNFLNMVGQKGNGDCTPDDGDASWACDVSQSGGAGLLEALNAIRDTVTHMETRTEIRTQIVDCEWTLPDPPARQVLDFTKVNFQVTTGVDNPVQRIIAQVDEAGDCEDVDEAWYYDNKDEPTKILVCPNTCEMVRALEQSRIDILLGCDTIKID